MAPPLLGVETAEPPPPENEPPLLGVDAVEPPVLGVDSAAAPPLHLRPLGVAGADACAAADAGTGCAAAMAADSVATASSAQCSRCPTHGFGTGRFPKHCERGTLRRGDGRVRRTPQRTTTTRLRELFGGAAIRQTALGELGAQRGPAAPVKLFAHQNRRRSARRGADARRRELSSLFSVR